jgi:Sap, sulfolipid-1-addressing protein
VSGDLGALAAAGLGIALSPLPLLFAFALLGTSRPLGNAVAFVAGEALAVGGIATAAVFFASDPTRPRDSVAGTLRALEIVIGLGLAALLVLHLSRPRRHEGLPRWSALLDGVGPGGAFAGGLAMVALNPKNLALTLAGAASIVQLGYSVNGRAAGVIVFTTGAVSLLSILIALSAALPHRSTELVGRAHSFVLVHERVLVACLLGALAAFFLLRGLLGTLT